MVLEARQLHKACSIVSAGTFSSKNIDLNNFAIEFDFYFSACDDSVAKCCIQLAHVHASSVEVEEKNENKYLSAI